MKKIYEVVVQTTTIQRGTIYVEAESAVDAVAFANADQEWLDDGMPEDLDYMNTAIALHARQVSDVTKLKGNWDPTSIAWGCESMATIAESVKPNA